MTKVVEVRGLEELNKKMWRWPMKYNKVIAKAHLTANLIIQENIPPYPPQPARFRYRRTGNLGRSFGVSMSGSAIGVPSIFTVRRVGGGFESRVGSRLRYAADVVGDVQKPFFATYWWKFSTTAGRSYGKIKDVFNIAVEELARYLTARGIS